MSFIAKLILAGLTAATMVGCSSGEKSSRAPAPPPPPQASLPVQVSPQAKLSGGSNQPVNQPYMQARFDECMSLQRDTQICSRRVFEDCKVQSADGDCRGMLQNLKILRTQ